MTGSEHYRAAEAILAEAQKTLPVAAVNALIATAQVHATLALAAMTEAAR